MTGLNGHQGRGDVSPPWNPFTFFGSGECREEEERLLMKATGAEELKGERFGDSAVESITPNPRLLTPYSPQIFPFLFAS